MILLGFFKAGMHVDAIFGPMTYCTTDNAGNFVQRNLVAGSTGGLESMGSCAVHEQR